METILVARRARHPLAGPVAFIMNARPNHLLVTADHLRHDTLGHTGDPLIRTPAIDRLAGEGVRFEENLYHREPGLREEMRRAYYALLDRTEDFRHPRYQRFTGVDPETGREITHYHTW